MTARDDYPEIERITRGVGVECIEDAEEQAAAALDEIDRLRELQQRTLTTALWSTGWHRPCVPDGGHLCVCGQWFDAVIHQPRGDHQEGGKR